MNIFKEGQKVERFIEEAIQMKVVVFPCPRCGHRNRPGKGNVDRVKMYLLDQLPPCTKCHAVLPKERYDRSTISVVYRQRALEELGFPREVAQCLRCRQLLRVPTDKGKICVTCKCCAAKFEFDP